MPSLKRKERILQFKPAFQLAGQGEVQHLKGGAQKQGLSQGTISRTASPAGWKSRYLASWMRVLSLTKRCPSGFPVSSQNTKCCHAS